MDEVVQKWGFGSGVSLFIAAGIGWRLFAQLFQFIGTQGTFEASGKVLAFVSSIVIGDMSGVLLAIYPIIITAALFFAVVFAQSLKVEIPLAYDRIRGHSVKWPLQFFYSGVMPVILVSALAANLQLFASLVEGWLGHATFLGGFSGGQPVSGLAYWIHAVSNFGHYYSGKFQVGFCIAGSRSHSILHLTFNIVCSFLVSTSGMDAKGQANRIIRSGLSMLALEKMSEF
jgi:preprotein translocase subunit SecY